ncbi:MAG: TonB family protein [Terriglobales bacterium]
MSAATAPAFERRPRRFSPRQPINVPVDLIALRSGVPENLPGRCTDISEVGVGAVVAGEMATGQHVAVELRLPNVGVPVRARALVRYQSRLRCGLEFVGLSAEQRDMIRYWIYRSAAQPMVPAIVKDEKGGAAKAEAPVVVAEFAVPTKHRIRIGRRGLVVLIACMLALAGIGWWQWQRSWSDLENRLLVGEEGFRVPSETMEKRIETKVEPVYPEAARTAGLEGLVVLDAVIASDGSVKRLRSVSGPDVLVQAATEAVRSWKFEPYLFSGKAVEVETTITVEFRLH